MLIIGLGNLQRGDDAAGLMVVQRLRERGIPAIAHAGNMLDLIEIWKNSDSAIVIDAVCTGAAPGTVHIWDPATTSLLKELFRSSTHEFGLADAVELARTLNCLPQRLTIFGIEGQQFEPGGPPLSEVLTGIHKAAEMIALGYQ